MSAEAQVWRSDPAVLGGTPVFAGTRVPVRSLFDYLEAGESLDDATRLWRRSKWRAIPCCPVRILLDENIPVDLAASTPPDVVNPWRR